MKKVFFISMIALSLGVCAFFITLANFENGVEKNIDIVPIRIDSDKEYAVAESSIRINPQVIEQEEIKDVVEKVSEKKVQEVVAKPKKEVFFVKPCNGNVITAFAENNLLYSNTLKEWVIHDGVDISLENGEAIFSVCDGNIIDIRYEHKLGYVIEIQNEEYVVKYACIEVMKGLKVGDKVKQGMQIAIASNDLGFEQDNGLHLHLEIFKNGSQINPSDVI